MATTNDNTADDQIRTAGVFPRDLDDENFLLWVQSIGYVIEKLNENSDGTPDIEIRHLAQIQQYLVGQFASARNPSTAATAG